MKFAKIFSLGFLIVGGLYGCVKTVQQGFLSNNLIYTPNPFVAVKGRTTTSGPMQVDGSTVPFNVKLLSLRSKYGKPMDALEKEYEIAVYKGNITEQDTTIELVNKKIGTGMYKPISINPIGGRIEVSPASNFIDTGTYVIDVEVSNMAGTKVKNNACEIKILPATIPYDITTQSATTSPANAEVYTTATGFAVTIARIATPENKIIIKFVDKNNVPFNPKAGQLIPRADRPTFVNYDPFYKEEKTDTAVVYQYPAKLPTFPLFPVTVSGGIYNYISYYRIPYTANTLDLNLNPVIGFRLWPAEGEPFVSGTFIITAKLPFATKK
jgi:hypothetical protein